MRDVGKKSSLGFDQRFDPGGHQIEVLTEIGDLIATL
jgi:hypothetical protein